MACVAYASKQSDRVLAERVANHLDQQARVRRQAASVCGGSRQHIQPDGASRPAVGRRRVLVSGARATRHRTDQPRHRQPYVPTSRAFKPSALYNMTHTHTHNRLTAFGPGQTRVGRYQKKHSPTHTHPDHRTSFIIFLHLQRSMASSLFILRA